MDLSTFLRSQGLTQEDFAKRIGCRQATVSRILSGKSMVSLHLALQIQKATDGQVMAEDLPISSSNRKVLEMMGAAA